MKDVTTDIAREIADTLMRRHPQFTSVQKRIDQIKCPKERILAQKDLMHFAERIGRTVCDKITDDAPIFNAAADILCGGAQ